MRNSLIALGAVCALSGCAGGVTKAYSGPERPESELSVIDCSLNVTIRAVDGDSKYSGSKSDCDFAVLPGKHWVTMTYYQNDYTANATWVYDRRHTIEFNTEAGYRYSLMALNMNGMWKLAVVNERSKKSPESTPAESSYVKYEVIQ